MYDMFNRYPYINLTDRNLDFITKTIRQLENEVKNFVSLNAIKYANPIQWNITSSYEKNTIVIDPLTGTAYISVAPVPSGVALTRTDFWTVVFDLQSFVTRAAKNFTSRWEKDTTLTATFNTPNGGWLVWGDTLYKAVTNITAGDSYVVNSNIVHFTIEDLYESYLETINIINDNIETLFANLGDVEDLNTTNKDNVVAAINELLDTVDSNTSAIADIERTLIDELEPLYKSKPINVLTLGVDNTGETDCTDIINTALENNSLYFPLGVYKISSPIYAKHNIYGAGNSHGSSVPNNNYPSRTLFLPSSTFTGDAAIIINGERPAILKDFDISLYGSEHGVDITPSEGLFNKIDNVSIINISSYGIYVAPSRWTSKPVYINCCAMWGKQYANSTGLYFSTNAADCMVTRTWIMGIQRGILTEHNLLILNDVHIWNGTFSGVDVGEWWSGTVGIETKHAHLTATNLYIDSPLVVFKGDNYSDLHISNFIHWFDTTMLGSNRYDATLQYQFSNGKIVIDNGFIRVTNRMQYATADVVITNNVMYIYDDNVTIQNSSYNAIFPELKENTMMYIRGTSGESYKEIACVYIPYYGSAEIKVASSYTNVSTIKIVRDISNIHIAQYDELSTEAYYYVFADNKLTIYRHCSTNETINVTLIESTKDVHVFNYNMMKYSNMNEYIPAKQNDTTGLTSITKTSTTRTDWVQYTKTVTVPANSSLSVVLDRQSPLAGYITGIASQSIGSTDVGIQNCQFRFDEGVRVNLRKYTAADVTTAVEVWMSCIVDNKLL